jgi:hypothetical protein
VNYPSLLSDAWFTLRSRRHLWLLGLLAGLTLGQSFWVLGNRFVLGGLWLLQAFPDLVVSRSRVSTALLLLGAALWPLGLLARSALVVGVSDVRRPGGAPPEGLGPLLGRASRTLPRIVLMQLLVGSPLIALNLVLVILRILAPETALTIMRPGQLFPPDMHLMALAAVLEGGAFLVSIPVAFLDAFAFRAVVLERLGPWNAVARAVTVLRRGAGPILVLSLGCFAVGMALSLLIEALVSPLGVLILRHTVTDFAGCAAAGGGLEAVTDCVLKVGRPPAVVLTHLTGSALRAALSSIWIAFQSAVFTLAYQRLAGGRSVPYSAGEGRTSTQFSGENANDRGAAEVISSALAQPSFASRGQLRICSPATSSPKSR